jgi:hypothetical protein
MEDVRITAMLQLGLVLIALCALLYMAVHKLKAKNSDDSDAYGDDVPPVQFTDSIHPRPRAADFGKSPNRW